MFFHGNPLRSGFGQLTIPVSTSFPVEIPRHSIAPFALLTPRRVTPLFFAISDCGSCFRCNTDSPSRELRVFNELLLRPAVVRGLAASGARSGPKVRVECPRVDVSDSCEVVRAHILRRDFCLCAWPSPWTPRAQSSVGR